MTLLSDVQSLKENPVAEVRQSIAAKVGVYYTNGIFDTAQSDIACDIIRMLARDVELRVRKTLSENLRNCQSLPHDIALKLAHDVQEVALPMLEFSSVLTDEDLLEIIRSTSNVGKLIAISRRNNASEALSGELINTSNEPVVVSLFSNGTAKIAQGSLEYAFNQFKNSGKVIGALINRGDLSLSVVEKILNAVSAQIREELVSTHKLDENKAAILTRIGQEKITLGLLNEVDEEEALQAKKNAQIKPINNDIKSTQTENLVNHLFKEGRLSESLILRSLCEGNLQFFELAMARLAGIPVINAKTLLKDGNAVALKSLWKRAKMPESVFDAMNVIINYAVLNLNGKTKNHAYTNQLLEYIQAKGYDKTVPLMPYIMALIAGRVNIKDVV